MNDLYSVTLNRAQIARIVEGYVIASSTFTPEDVSARCELPPEVTEFVVRVSPKRQRKPRAKVE